ncbi:terminase large subunit [Sutterella sp.]|uniref:terminase large subunit n=1 Tax=Sutterella sp. TaxID=1981025 RepID=UPI0026E008FE|nr:terminase TerL endonuclease subunit [Sutterella sp.]MDO5531415.1 terminase large subunit [Sutterella sp.]
MIANRYIERVLSGKQPACKWVKLACQRQKDDLKRWAKSGLYVWDKAKASRVCQFIELLTHTKGELAGQKIRLEPWQVFILTTVFGWTRRTDGGRRFRRVYIEVPRGNGKSAISSGVALYCLTADGELGAEVYSFATTRDQAKIVFGDAKVMAEQNATLRKRFGLEVMANALYVQETNSTFRPKSADGSTLDGLNTHLGVIDELHAHKTRAVYDVVETSLGKRKNSLLWCITTAGFETAGICYEVRTIATKVLTGEAKAEAQFAIIYTIDEDDDWKSLDALRKANPNWGISVEEGYLTDSLDKALTVPSSAPNFKTKHLDVWCTARSAWLDMVAWKNCEDRQLSLDDFEGRRCVIGLDLGAKSDITAKVYVFPFEDADGEERYAVFPAFYLPERAVEVSPVSQYRGWAESGQMHVTDGAMTDLNLVEEELREDLSRFDVDAIVYDPWQAAQMVQSLSNDGAPMIDCRMSTANISEPMKNVEAMVLDGRIRHPGQPVLDWMMGNVTAKVDANDNVYPRKEDGNFKIDGAVALIMAMRSVLNAEEDKFGDLEALAQPATFLSW